MTACRALASVTRLANHAQLVTAAQDEFVNKIPRYYRLIIGTTNVQLKQKAYKVLAPGFMPVGRLLDSQATKIEYPLVFNIITSWFYKFILFRNYA